MREKHIVVSRCVLTAYSLREHSIHLHRVDTQPVRPFACQAVVDVGACVHVTVLPVFLTFATVIYLNYDVIPLVDGHFAKSNIN